MFANFPRGFWRFPTKFQLFKKWCCARAEDRAIFEDLRLRGQGQGHQNVSSRTPPLPIMLLCLTHIENSVSTDECKILLMILDYNQRKGGVDMTDENLEEFLCRRKTVRWPLLFFYHMVDAAANNVYILMKKCGKYSKSKKCLLKNLSFQLPKSAAENRLRLAKQKYSVRDAAAQVGFSIPTEPNVTPRRTVSSHQKRCRVRKKQTRLQCRPSARIA